MNEIDAERVSESGVTRRDPEGADHHGSTVSPESPIISGISEMADQSSDDEEDAMPVSFRAARFKSKARRSAFLQDDSDDDDDEAKEDADPVNVDQTAESSDDEAPINRTKASRIKSVFLEDDSSDEDDAKDKLDGAVFSHRRRSDGEDAVAFKSTDIEKRKKKRILEPLFGDDESSNVEPEMPVTSESRTTRRKVNKANAGPDFNHQEKPASFFSNNDLFDAEGSSDEDHRSNNSSDDADQDDLSDIKRKVKAKLKKASNESSSARPKRENVQQLHSESQRLVRESRTRLPRHIPLKKSLDEFIGRRKMVPKSMKAVDIDIETALKNVLLNGADTETETVVSLTAVTEDVSEEKDVILSSSACLMAAEIETPLSDAEPQPPIECMLELSDLITVSSARETPTLVSNVPEMLSQNFEHQSDAEECLKIGPEPELSLEPPVTPFEDRQDQATPLNKLKRRISLLDASVISRTPKLAGMPQQVILLDDDVNLGKSDVDDFIDRFVKHTFRNKPKILPQNQQVTLNILKKETDHEGRDQLRTESINIDVKPFDFDNNQTETTPGFRLKLLKDDLKMKLAVKREEARKRRILLHKMDNENEFEGEEDEEKEEEEEEDDEEEILSDETSESEDSESEEEGILKISEKKRERNMFVDDEAEDEDNDGDDDAEVTEDENAHETVADDKDEDEIDLSPNMAIPATQSDANNGANLNQNTLARCDTMELFPSSLTVLDQSPLDRQMNNSYEFNGSMIMDDGVSPYQASRNGVIRGFGVSQFAIADSPQSQLSQRESQVSVRRQLGLGFANDSTQENIDELFDLCSGKWTATDDSKELGVVALCGQKSQSTQENEAELFGLCSGQFIDPVIAADSMTQEAFDPDNPVNSRDLSDGELSNSSLISLDVGRDQRRRKTRRVMSDTESDNENESEAELQTAVLPSRRNGGHEFFEDEAELSGSEASSDEDEEIAIEDDILEEELGDQEYLSEDELREQVEKVHHKILMDDDQRQLRMYKELYLEDGELHSDGQVRMRKFRWRNVDDSQGDNDDAKSDASDGDVDNDGGDSGGDVLFRAQRHEREKWLTEYMNSHDDEVILKNVDSHFEQLTKSVTILSRQDTLNFDTHLSNQPLQSPKKSLNLANRGSFLNARRKDYLAKLVGQAKAVNKNGSSKINGPTSSRNFVFATVASPPPPPQQQQTPSSEAKPAQLRRVATTPASSLTINKRPRLDRQASLLQPDEQSQNSVFNLF